MSNPEGIDPTQLRAIARNAHFLSESAQDWKTKSQHAIDYFQLQDLAYSLVGYCGEISNEMFLLAELGWAKSEEIIQAAEGGQSPIDDGESEKYMAKLEASLDNSVGDSDPTKVSELDPKYAELVAQFQTDEDFGGPAYRDAVAKAMAEGDMDAVKALTDALWDHVASMSGAKARQFVNNLPPEIMVTAIASSGIPPVSAIVEYAVNLGDFMTRYGAGGTGSPVDWELHGYIKQRFGMDSRTIKDVSKLFANRLRNFADESPTNAEMVIFAAGKENPSVHYPGMENIAAVVRDAARKNPSIVAHNAKNDDEWTQNFSDLIVQGATHEDVNAVVNAVADFAARDLMGNKRGEDYTDPNGHFAALGRLEKCLKKTDHGPSLDYEGVAKALLGKIPHGDTVKELLELVKEDEVKERRADQSKIAVQKQNLALDMLCRIDPVKGKALLDAMGVGPEGIAGLTYDQWSLTRHLVAENVAIQQLLGALDPAFANEAD